MSGTKDTHKKKEIPLIHQGKAVTDMWRNNLKDSLTYSFMDPLFDYLKEDKSNELTIE